MRITRWLFYISGHGFGHARRSAEVMKVLLQRKPDLHIHVRTSAPAGIFARLPRTQVENPPVSIDSGVIERDPLTIDVPATVCRVENVLATSGSAVEAELAFIRQNSIALILADIPCLPGAIAAAAKLPCIAIGNFTWDWIYEAILPEDKVALVDRVREMYSQMTAALRLPFHHEFPQFRQVHDVALVTNRPAMEREQILRRLHLADDSRKRILLGLRGGIAPDLIRAAIKSCPELVFLSPHPLDPSMPENVRHVSLGADLDFTDCLAACDGIISKLGYGTVAECLATGTPILFPPRENFREEELFLKECPRFLQMRQISMEDFQSGRWAEPLHALLAQPPAPGKMEPVGADACADYLLHHFG